jgi:hypothetical protein
MHVHKMAVWAWVAVSVGAFLGMSVILGLALGVILGRIAESVTGLREHEVWASAPLTREDDLAPRRARRKARSLPFG